LRNLDLGFDDRFDAVSAMDLLAIQSAIFSVVVQTLTAGFDIGLQEN
jgi:hypothetical protein